MGLGSFFQRDRPQVEFYGAIPALGSFGGIKSTDGLPGCHIVRVQSNRIHAQVPEGLINMMEHSSSSIFKLVFGRPAFRHNAQLYDPLHGEVPVPSLPWAFSIMDIFKFWTCPSRKTHPASQDWLSRRRLTLFPVHQSCKV